jgi:hypothetical protein
LRKFLIERRHRLQQRDQAALAHRLDHQTVPFAVHDGFVARQFEFYRDADRLVAAVAKQPDVPGIGHARLLGIWHKQMPARSPSQERDQSAISPSGARAEKA